MLENDVQQLPRELYDKAKKFKISRIMVRFRGGSDEANLEIEFTREDSKTSHSLGQFEVEIEDWVWTVYSYNGAGDGTDYGDDITYDLVNMTISAEEWFYEEVRNDFDPVKLEIEGVKSKGAKDADESDE